VACLVGPAVQAGADTVVLFVDGRSMVVEGIERDGEVAYLFLDGGGALSVPLERLANWHELPVAKPVEEQADVFAAGDEAWRAAAGEYADLFARAAAEHDLDPALLTAMAQVESAFDPNAVSPKGACGLLQLMPATADRFGVEDVFDVTQNVTAGARYMSWLLDRFDGQTDLALAGYNAGEGAVDKHAGIPPYRETRNYVRSVLDGASRLAELAP
jgi:soluble lytic murein transglycosylase-like protein